MALRFITGRSGSGKTAKVLNEIRDRLWEDPAGKPIIYLVPDQMTFLSEYKLIKTPNLEGMMRAQVFSFSRLAWRILQETGGGNRHHLDSVGVNMLIRKIMEGKKDELKMFRRSADKPGFVMQMEEMLAEFKRYCLNPKDINEFREYSLQQSSDAVRDKLHDLELIYQAFEDELVGKYLDSEDYFRLLIEKLAQSSYIAEASIYIDGFYSLTPQELQIVEGLLKLSKDVTVVLTLDQPYRVSPPDGLNLFRQTGQTYFNIYQRAVALGVIVENDEHLESAPRFKGNPGLAHLEANLTVRPAHEFNEDTSVTVVQALNRRAEVEGVARTILRLVRDGNHRFRDVAILVRNGESYHDLINTVFLDYQIPVFIDTKRTMLNHPLIELIRSTLEILNTNWRYEPVFRAIKTELLHPIGLNTESMREKVDRLENYVLSRGIKGNRWYSKDPWIYRRIRGLELEEGRQTNQEKQLEDELNELKELFNSAILRLSKRLKRAQTGQEMCESLYLYLEELHIPEKLEKLKVEAEERDDLISAREHEQAWDAIVNLLDQFVELLSEEKMTLKQFSTIMESGFETLKFSLVPPAIDQVLVASLDLSRLDDIRTAFVMGLNEGVLPGKAGKDGILSDQDRENLAVNGFELAPSSKLRLLDEEFIAYKAFATPSESLYLTYPLADEEGKALLPSSYIKRVKDVLPKMQEAVFMNDPSDLDASEQAEYAANYDVALSYLTAQLQLKKRNYPVHPVWWDVYNAYMDHERMRPEAVRVLSSLFYQNKTKRISAETSKKIYGENILASVSRMELFNSCAFAHYAAHGLKLKERKIFRLDAPDIGEMFHGALKIISDYLYERNISWSSLTKEQCLMLARKAVERLAPKLQNQILLSSNRHHYLKRKLEQVIGRASIVLSEQAKQSGFVPVGLELGFGKNGQLPPLSFELKDGTKMELVGRIDRIDKAEENDSVYLRVLDYKSSEKDLNLSEVYYGLALQMLTYLDIVITHSNTLVGKDALPAGVLYFHVHNPVVKSKGMVELSVLEQEIFKSFKMKGLLLGDPDVVQLMDQSLEQGVLSNSNMIPAGLKKDGTLQAKSKIASQEEFSLLQNHIRHLYQEAGNEIVGGNVEINPYKLKDKVPCTFCTFKSVCQFDQSTEDNEYRLLSANKQDEVLNVLRREVPTHE
ncbi:helicase-exonuclease AddAB subunit AddB [Peribacillus huizhouensis]|uniref:ATP-dependent helicase/deoxyribonuclease subunit B n=1 Tax=Peribacillus huizhouensis TaxID=1501239 RepID=A0ABR6CJK8_9BACI|nr:helicase-exonuclease AddAB subunit AddB [Peribacillus huizhouensis]MBA9025237.1 ATP-dependent helicase/nuclease subunit B [Peribacillus huizhouensis]